MPSLEQSSFITSSLIFTISLVLFITSVKYDQTAQHASPGNLNLTTLILYTSLPSLLSIITALIHILLLHLSYEPSPLPHLLLTCLFSITYVFLLPLTTRCELILPTSALPSICPSPLRIYRLSHLPVPEGRTATTATTMWFSVSVARTVMIGLLAMGYLGLSALVGREWWEEHKRSKGEAREWMELEELRTHRHQSMVVRF